MKSHTVTIECAYAECPETISFTLRGQGYQLNLGERADRQLSDEAQIQGWARIDDCKWCWACPQCRAAEETLGIKDGDIVMPIQEEEDGE